MLPLQSYPLSFGVPYFSGSRDSRKGLHSFWVFSSLSRDNLSHPYASEELSTPFCRVSRGPQVCLEGIDPGPDARGPPDRPGRVEVPPPARRMSTLPLDRPIGAGNPGITLDPLRRRENRDHPIGPLGRRDARLGGRNSARTTARCATSAPSTPNPGHAYLGSTARCSARIH